MAAHDLSLVAILRGVKPDEIVDVAAALVRAGVEAIEVPLNSPEPLLSIERLCDRFGDVALCGAGTVLTPKAVDQVQEVGGRLIVTPNIDVAVIARAVAANLTVMPGFVTPTEAFAAIAAGARRLKLFPASTFGANYLRAIRAVLPGDVTVHAVGGVGAGDLAPWVQAGAMGFGIGGDLYRPGDSAADIEERARTFVAALKAARGAG